MKFTLNWLKDHLETEASAREIGDRLTMLGHECEGLEDRAAALAPFTVGYVKEAKRHPDADRLSVCIVDTGSGEVQVVCGAPNARSGMKGVFAASGSYIPGTIHTGVLKKTTIRGVESNGMLLSEREVGMSDEHEGIIELPEDAPLGASVAGILGLDDPVIDIAITPNRGDCLGVHGVARDLAAAGLGKLKPFDKTPVPAAFESPVGWLIDLPEDKADACPFVVGRYFRNVENRPSPKWLQDRLRAIGLRPISALVDITNYVTFDLGRPLHVFDAEKLKGDLTMRLAEDGEGILALDGKAYTLDSEMVVIGDKAAVQGIGGVMGGELSGCTETTTEVFLEVALFDPVRVAATGRKLGIISDARYRFERGVDPQSALWGAEVAARLILEFCGGEASAIVTAGTLPRPEREIELRPERARTLGGLDLPVERQRTILADLGFEPTERNGAIVAAVPTWRPDMDGEADLVEEILRIHGFEHIPQAPLTLDTTLPLPAISLRQRRVAAARTALAWRGMNEAVTYSFLASAQAALFGGVPESLRLANPISSDLDVMRPSILPNLAAAAARNADRGLGDAALFEVGPQYRDDTPDGEDLVAAALRVGQSGPRHWDARPRPVDAFDAKGDALAVLEACGAPVASLQVTADAPVWYHPGRSGILRLGPKVLAHFGELHPRVLRAFGLRGPAAAVEIFLQHIPEPRAKAGRQRPALELSPFHPVERDFAFVVGTEVPAEKLIRAARAADKVLITKVEVFDTYAGKGIEEGKKSLAIAVTIQPREKTLTDPEIEGIAKKIVQSVEKATGGTLRA
jgi:phenylalanyl-tRNA synthetase beta chain